jgi:hypothetical protein
MANPSSRWDRVPVYGVYLTADDQPVPGTVNFGFATRVTRVDGRIIYPQGATRTATIGNTDQQDSTIRSVVRAAWRAADAASAGGGFDGTAWDTWWDDVIVPAAIFTSFPALDDPDITQQEGAAVLVKEALTTGLGKQYAITPLLAQLDTPIPGINLGTIEVPPGSPTVPAPMYAKGVAGGVASLDETAKVPLEQLPDDIGGGATTVDGLTDVTTVGKAVVTAADAAAARSAIGAQPAGSYLTSVPSSSTTTAGVVELATVTEAKAGTDTARAVTPAGLSGAISDATAGRGLYTVVWDSTAGAYPTIPSTPPAGVTVREFVGPTNPASLSITAWSGVVDLYTYAAI